MYTHVGQDRGTHVCIQLWKGDGAEVKSQVDMHACPDVCSYSTSDVGQEDGLLGHTQGAGQMCTFLHTTMQRGGADVGSQVNMHTCTNACTHCKVWGQMWGDWDTYMGSCVHTCLHSTMERGWCRYGESDGHAYMY